MTSLTKALSSKFASFHSAVDLELVKGWGEKGGRLVMVGVGINLFGLSAGSNTKRSITQSPGSTRSLGLSLTDPTDIDRGWTAKSICS